MRRVEIAVTVQPIGKDWLFTVTGGVAHIGAVATASSRDTAHIRTTELPGHREGQLAARLAGWAAERLGATVVVVAGIHLPNASPEEIDRIVADAENRFLEVLAERIHVI